MKHLRNSTLDIIRGLAALEVLFTHLQHFIFEDFSQLHDPSLVVRAFYYLTGFGHQAVVVFFVLSGYLVGGSILTAKQEGFWTRYSIQRLSRLWIVLLPCLLATLVLNWLGYHTGGTEYLTGGMNPPMGIAPLDGIRTDLPTFFGNLLFLQTIITPIFGDNGPLWSLANEFWYYLLFPLLFFGLKRTQVTPAVIRCLLLGAAIALICFLPRTLVLGFVVWLCGVAVSATGKSRFFDFMKRTQFGVLALVTCLLLLHLSLLGDVPDVLLGLAFAASLPWLLQLPTYARLASFAAWLSDFSYTLYLTHFSFAAYLWYALFHSQRLEPSPTAVGRFIAASIFIVGYSFTMSVIFERNTDRFRRFMMKVIMRKTETGSASR